MNWFRQVWWKKSEPDDCSGWHPTQLTRLTMLIAVTVAVTVPLAVPTITRLRPIIRSWMPQSLARAETKVGSAASLLRGSVASSTESLTQPIPQAASPEAASETVPQRPPSPQPAKVSPPGAASTKTAKASCAAKQPSTELSEPLLSDGMTLMGHWGAVLAAQLSARPFPEVHSMARLARVPVIMYHDILPEKQVFFDVTPAEFEADLQLLQKSGVTPIRLDQLVSHLSTGVPLPAKPVVLTFDDGYQGHYDYVYPLLKKYGYPGLFGIYTHKVGKTLGRSSLSWAQLRQMAADPLITIASHSVSHPPNLAELSENRLRNEVVQAKRILETELGIPINYFVYPEGKYDARVQQWVKLAGYQAALTMDDSAERYAGASETLLSIERIGQGSLETAIAQAYGGPPLPLPGNLFRFDAPVQFNKITMGAVPLMMASGGRPVTLHADSRYQVDEIIAETNAIAAVDGGFFSLESLDSNVMVGPVLSQSSGKFVPSPEKEARRIAGRPLVLISPTQVKYLPFDPQKHNTLAGLQAALPDVTDAFVAAAWLVKNNQPQPAKNFGNLFDFDAARDRAFWGIDQAGRPVVGVSGDFVDSVTLGEALRQAGLRDAVMLDSGASASLVFQGQSQMSYEPRPVPHVVALVPSEGLQLYRNCR
jgi:poly-beta-1,6-N-acetyl-D-glucosamine N-deacetylase